jgi:hypothetical protein
MGRPDCTSAVKIWHYMSNSQKGDVICNKYRRFTVPCATYKILANISYVKLVTYSAEIIGKYQEGF